MLPREYFKELEDKELRAMLDKHLPEDARKRDFRVASLTWCVYGKKWLIKVERKEACSSQENLSSS